MVCLKKPSSPASTATFARTINYSDLLRRAHQQKILAREMVERAKQMIDSAVEMRNSRAVHLPVGLVPCTRRLP